MGRKIGYILIGILTITTAAFIWSVVALNMLPLKYMVMIFGIVIAILILCTTVHFIAKKKIITYFGKAVSVIMIISLSVGTVYTIKAKDAIEAISGIEIKLDNMVVSVLAENEIESIVDAGDYVFGVEVTDDGIGEYTAIIIEEIEAYIGESIEIKEYASLIDEIEALENGEVEAIIYNEAYVAIIEDDDPDFSESVKTIFEHGIEIELESNEDTELIEVESEAYTVYISGIDVYGSISQTSRSDVNIIATVNPTTEQILLVTTPRDYYVQIPEISGDSYDKLTHAGLYGVDVSVATLEELYDIEIDFYARVNFTSMITMVDALGGISVYSNQSFWTTAHNGVSYYVEEGYNEFSGIEALYFARERYNIDGGDYQRGENQEEIIKAMIEKATSPSIITGAYEILESISENLDTNMSTEQIQELIKTQIDEGTEWEVIMMSAEGESGTGSCYSSWGEVLSVSYPVEESVAEITAAIEAIYNNEILVQGTE